MEGCKEFDMLGIYNIDHNNYDSFYKPVITNKVYPSTFKEIKLLSKPFIDSCGEHICS